MIFKKKYNILILGSNGMLGHDVYEHFKRLSAVKSSNVGIVTGISGEDNCGVDVTEQYSLSEFFSSSIHYDYCINCIAYTDTNKAESTEEGQLESYRLNALVPEHIAASCSHWNTKLIHMSTDYVFSEHSDEYEHKTYSSEAFSSANAFYQYSETFPKNIYGMHKLLGEKNIANAFKDKKKWCVLRTSWLYGMHKSKSFIHKFMKNVVKACKRHANGLCLGEPIEVEVNDIEHSIPTSTECVICCIDKVIENGEYGIVHAVPYIANSYSTYVPSRYDFAHEILSWYDREVIDGVCLSEVKITKPMNLPDNFYWPKFSALRSSFVDVYSWQYYLERFMEKNKKEILGFAIKENAK